MSTRATYKFRAAEFVPAITVYIHHDGYPSGAAQHFYEAMQIGSLSPEAMIRSNVRALITESHEIHGDTEFRYSINGRELVAENRTDYGWQPFFTGDCVDFVNRYINTKENPEFKPLEKQA